MPEFIIGLVCLFGGFGMIYTAIHLDKDKFDCAFMAFVFFLSAAGFIGGSMQRPSPSKRDVLKGDAVYVSDTINNNGEKVAYLTFDDGPNNSVTPQVLDVLRRYNVKATFFMVGSMIEKNPDVARRVFEEGHLIAGHSYSHQYSELYADTQSFMNEVNKSYELIKNVTARGDYPKIFRFPGGGFDAGVYGEIKQECKVLLEKDGYRYCDWNALNGDAETSSPAPDELVKRLKSTAKNKEDIVVLMHDAPSKAATAKALPQIIEYLIGEGYAFDTLNNT